MLGYRTGIMWDWGTLKGKSPTTIYPCGVSLLTTPESRGALSHSSALSVTTCKKSVHHQISNDSTGHTMCPKKYATNLN